MPKTLVQLSVLISCPADMTAERQVVKAAVEEVNSLLAETQGVLLNTISWESDLLPGVGPDPQSVINSQILGRYDIYLGLLGTRFGTQTPRAGSGTEEEFNQAFDTYIASPEKLRVLFYFGKTSDDVHRLDLDQLRKVLDFRKKLSTTTLFYEFSDRDGLLKLLKDHLRHLVIEQWDGKKWKVLSPLPRAARLNLPSQIGLESRERVSLSAPLGIGEEDKECDEQERTAAILDAIVSAEDGFRISTEALEKITVLGSKLTSDFTSRVAALPPGPAAREMKAIVDGAADDLAEYANGLKREIPIVKVNLNEALNGLDTAIELYFTEKLGDPTQLRDIPQQLAFLAKGIREGRASLDYFRKALVELPGFTVKFKKSKRIVKRLLDDFSAAITVFLDKAESIQLRFPSKPTT
jgi:hypothetical protein